MVNISWPVKKYCGRFPAFDLEDIALGREIYSASGGYQSKKKNSPCEME